MDDLHERAGSTCILHVHGEITKARSTKDSNLIYNLGYNPIQIGDHCEKGSQLRPHVVWFGEHVMQMEASEFHFRSADKVLVVGTSLSVYPVAGLVRYSKELAEKTVVSLEIEAVPDGYRFVQGDAAKIIPKISKS